MEPPIMNAGMLAGYTHEPEKNIDQVTIQTVPFITAHSIQSSVQGPKQKKHLLPPSAHAGFSKLKSRLKGGSTSKDPNETQEPRPESSCKKSLDIEQSDSPKRLQKENTQVAKITATAKISPLAMEPRLATTEHIPIQIHANQQTRSIENGTSPGSIPALQSAESAENEISRLQKELKQAKAEIMEAKTRYSQLETECKQSRDANQQNQSFDFIQYQGEEWVNATATKTEEPRRIDQLLLDLQSLSAERDALKEAVSELEKNLEETCTKWKSCHNRLLEVKAKSQQQENEMASVQETNQALANRAMELELQLKDLQARGDQYLRDPSPQMMSDEVAYLTEENRRIHEQLNRLVEQSASEATKNIDSYFFDDPYCMFIVPRCLKTIRKAERFRNHPTTTLTVWIVKREFSSVRGGVKDWAIRVFELSRMERKPSKDAEGKLRTTSAFWDVYMKSQDHRVAFVQAYLWGHLLRSLFGRWNLEEEIGRPNIETAADQERLFHAFRYAAARCQAPKGWEKQAMESWVSQNMSQTLDDIFDPLEAWSTLPKAESCRLLHKVLEDVVRLDLQMRQQKAYFQVCGPKEVATFLNLSSPHDVVYDAQSMESRWGSPLEREKQRVELFIAPMLVKRGNADGQDYGGPAKVLEKAEVDLKRPKSKRSLLGV